MPEAKAERISKPDERGDDPAAGGGEGPCRQGGRPAIEGAELPSAGCATMLIVATSLQSTFKVQWCVYAVPFPIGLRTRTHTTLQVLCRYFAGTLQAVVCIRPSHAALASTNPWIKFVMF